jgi:hypothetical protein
MWAELLTYLCIVNEYNVGVINVKLREKCAVIKDITAMRSLARKC